MKFKGIVNFLIWDFPNKENAIFVLLESFIFEF